MSRFILSTLVIVGLVTASSSNVFADHCNGGYGGGYGGYGGGYQGGFHGGYSSGYRGNGFGVQVYSAPRYSYAPSYTPAYQSQSYYHNTSHYDYHAPSLQRHRGHYDYVPGHYDYHQTGHYDH